MVKHFPGVKALRGVDFVVWPGEVHGLVGENGAGKSTLVKIILGAYGPDSGTVEIFGVAPGAGDPRAQRRAGVAAVYQEPTIVPEMSAAGNVFLGRPPRRALGFVDRRTLRRRFYTLAREIGAEIAHDVAAGDLALANQRLIEIMRALNQEHRILVMDEPTASLGPQDRERLYEIVGKLKDAGTSIIYVSHDLDEVLALCDRVSVMRDGRLIASKESSAWTNSELVTAMLGRQLLGDKASRSPTNLERGDVLRVENVSIRQLLRDVSFNLQRGEILGIAGLVGSGRTELLRALAGADRPDQGRLFVDGRETHWPRSIRRALELGIALAPEDRKTDGLVLTRSGAVNMTLSDLRSISRGTFIQNRVRSDRAGEAATAVGFDRGRLDALAGTLSGGNQQKLMIARWLHRKPRVLLLDDPSRGIDIGAKEEIFSVIARLAEEGMSIVLVSSELEELERLAHRVVVLGAGRQLAILAQPEATVDRMLRLIFAVEDAA